jgi:3-hydroxyacyl-CoA dehydrogenase
MQILIVGIGALGGTIAARAIRTGLPVRLAARNTDSAEALRRSVRDRRGKVPLAEQHRSGRRISADAGEVGIPHLPDSVMEVDSDVE